MYNKQCRKTVLLGCIYKGSKMHCVFSDNDCLIRIYQSFVAIFSYYAGIMLNAFSHLLCSKLCCHNWLVPTSNNKEYNIRSYSRYLFVPQPQPGTYIYWKKRQQQYLLKTELRCGRPKSSVSPQFPSTTWPRLTLRVPLDLYQSMQQISAS